MRILVTRPLPEGADVANGLGQRGYRPLLSPVLAIMALPPSVPQGTFDAILVTSARAFLADWVPGLLAKHSSIPVYAAGSNTTREAQKLESEAAISDSRVVFLSYDARGLAAMLVPRQPSRFLYLAGRERKSYVETLLSNAGHCVVTIETYAALAVAEFKMRTLIAFHAGEIDAVMHYSRRSAEIFLDLAKNAGLTEKTLHLQHYCISDDTAEPLRAMGALHVHVAAKPDAAGFYAMLPPPDRAVRYDSLARKS